MKTLELTVNENDYTKFFGGKKKISFSEIKTKIESDIFQRTLEQSIILAKEAGLDKMSLEDINKEIESVRNSA